MVEAIARRQAAAGHRVTVYGSRLVCDSGWVDGVRVLALPTVAHKYLGPVLLQLAGAAHALACGGYDVVHLHGAENGFVVPLLRLRYPVVTTNHGPAYLREKWSGPAKALIRAADGLSVRPATRATAVSTVQAAELSRRYGREVVAIPNGVDLDEPVDEEGAERLLAELGLRPGEYLLFAAARVDPTKGCHTLLEALGRLPEPPPLLVVGDLFHAPGYEERLRALARGLPVTLRAAPRRQAGRAGPAARRAPVRLPVRGRGDVDDAARGALPGRADAGQRHPREHLDPAARLPGVPHRRRGRPGRRACRSCWRRIRRRAGTLPPRRVPGWPPATAGTRSRASYDAVYRDAAAARAAL